MTTELDIKKNMWSLDAGKMMKRYQRQKTNTEDSVKHIKVICLKYSLVCYHSTFIEITVFSSLTSGN